MPEQKPRIHLLDSLRGLAVFCMVFYHGFLFLHEGFGFQFAGRLFGFFQPAQPFFASLFIVISGVSSRLSRSNTARGLKLLAVALGMSAVTIYILPLLGMEGAGIYFGILHLLAISMLIFAALGPLTDKVPAVHGLLICLTLYLLTFGVAEGYIGFMGYPIITLPRALYETGFLFPLGFFDESFASADYFPVLPNLFMFLAGTFIGVYAKEGKLPPRAYRDYARPLSFLGRHALVIYIAHAPVIYGVCYLVEIIF